VPCASCILSIQYCGEGLDLVARPVEYDFGAAHDLSLALGQLNSKLNDFGHLRATLRDSELASWTGERKTEYENAFGKQQRALADLADLAGRLKHDVDQATSDATRAKYPQTTNA
jgi:hypothetical protein